MKKMKLIKVTGIEQSLDGFMDDTKRLYNELGLSDLYDYVCNDKIGSEGIIVGSWWYIFLQEFITKLSKIN